MHKVLQHLELDAKNLLVPIIDNPTRQFIEQKLQQVKPIHCLEIGSAIWYSTICIAQKIQEWNGTLTSFEYSYPRYMIALDAINKSRLPSIVLYYWDFLKFSHALLPSKIDFLFIDAEKSLYLEYYLVCKPFLSDNATIIFDDVIKFKEKTTNLINHLHNDNILYSLHKLSDDDWILVIQN